MRGDIEEGVATGAHALFFPHGLGHMLGIDVHDMESLGEDFVGYDREFRHSGQFGLSGLRLARRLEAGCAQRCLLPDHSAGTAGPGADGSRGLRALLLRRCAGQGLGEL